MKECSTHICCKRSRQDVVSNVISDKKSSISADHIAVVLPDWKKIMKNCTRIGLEVSLNFFADNPQYKTIFPAFARIPDNDLIYNKYFRMHSEAVMRGIDSVFDNFSAAYETENEILPLISNTHRSRKVSRIMMARLKESLVYVCADFLNLNRKKKASWAVVFDYIFDKYVCAAYAEGCCIEEGFLIKRKRASRITVGPFQRKSAQPLI